MSTNTKARALYTGADAINKAIASIAGRGAKLDADIQHAALSIIVHVEAHGDTTLADRLMAAMPKGSRKLALAEWFLAFGMLETVAPKSEAAKAGRVFQINREKTTDVEGGTETPWTEFKKEADPVTAFDVQAAVQSLLAKLAKAQEKGYTVTECDEGTRAKLAKALGLQA